MTYISWDDVEKNKKSYSGMYFKIYPGEKVKIRPLGNPVVFKKYMFKYDEKWRVAICLDEDSCPVMKKHNIVPIQRCAINIIDRRHDRLSILESSPKVFREMKVFFEKTGKNPGGTDGAHFNYSLSNEGGKNAYSLEFAGSHTLSESDISLVKKSGLFLLKKIYKATPPEEIEKVLFGDIPGYMESESGLTMTEEQIENEVTNQLCAKDFPF